MRFQPKAEKYTMFIKSVSKVSIPIRLSSRAPSPGALGAVMTHSDVYFQGEDHCGGLETVMLFLHLVEISTTTDVGAEKVADKTVNV